MSKHVKVTDWQAIHRAMSQAEYGYADKDHKEMAINTKWAIDHPEYEYTSINSIINDLNAFPNWS